jgi:formylglycine-generating enzyme required for sulfatase activity
MSVNTRVRRGDKNKGQPKYMNKTKYTHNKNSKKTRYILSLPNVGLCEHCTDVIEWKKTYRKYKPLEQPKHCVRCHEASVLHAYHQICGKRTYSHSI